MREIAHQAFLRLRVSSIHVYDERFRRILYSDHKQVSYSCLADRKKKADLYSGAINMPDQLQSVCARARVFMCVAADARSPSGATRLPTK